jgi:hypothetical protein
MISQRDSSMSASRDSGRHSSAQFRPRRYEPASVYALVESLTRRGRELEKVRGPWSAIRRPLARPGRNAQKMIPIVTNGVAEVAVDTAERAADVSGLLNLCGVDHLEPVPNLQPPDEDLARD